MSLPLPANQLPLTSATTEELELSACSYEDRSMVLTAVEEAIRLSGCWVKDRRAVSFEQMEFRFEMRLAAALELYSALMGAGLELSQQSHAKLTGLCTLRRHSRQHRVAIGSIVSARLTVNFLYDEDLESGMDALGLA
jgi:hypothetical protein